MNVYKPSGLFYLVQKSVFRDIDHDVLPIPGFILDQTIPQAARNHLPRHKQASDHVQASRSSGQISMEAQSKRVLQGGQGRV